MVKRNSVRRYSIRKLKVGVASVCSGIFLLGSPAVLAEEAPSASDVPVENLRDGRATDTSWAEGEGSERRPRSEVALPSANDSMEEETQSLIDTSVMPSATAEETADNPAFTSGQPAALEENSDKDGASRISGSANSLQPNSEDVSDHLMDNAVTPAPAQVILQVYPKITVEEGTQVGPLDLIQVASINGVNASGQVTVEGDVNGDAQGLYTLTFTLRAQDGTEQTVTAQIEVVARQTSNFFVEDHNYYEDGAIDKGDLDLVIKNNVSQTVLEGLKASAAQGRIVYDEAMTYNDFYFANNLSPEDQFTSAKSPKVSLPNKAGVTINTDPSRGPVTQIVPPGQDNYNSPKGPVYSDAYMARLSIGTPPVNYKNYPLTSKPNTLGYGESGTVNDYMMSAENNLVIPARFNTRREDIWLTLRGSTHPTVGTKVFLSAKDEQGNKIGKDNDHFYLILNTVFGQTSYGTANMGYMAQFGFEVLGSKGIPNASIDDFNQGLNGILAAAEGVVGNTPAQLGGQVQIIGYYDDSDINDQYKANAAARLEDATNTVDVRFFMYGTGLTGADNSKVSNVPEEYLKDLNLSSSEGVKLYSPSVSQLSIDTTRPFFTQFGDLTTKILWDPSQTGPAFNRLLGANSYQINDLGVDKDGNAIGVDASRVRVRIRKQGDTSGATPVTVTVNQLQSELSKAEYRGTTVDLIYSYAAKDADDALIGLLPDEMNTEAYTGKGAYAVPIQRVVQIAGAAFKEIHEFFTKTDGVLSNTPDSSYTKQAISEYDQSITAESQRDTTPASGNLTGYTFSKLIRTVVNFDGTPVSGPEEIQDDGSAHQVDLEPGQLITYTYQYIREVVTNKPPTITAHNTTIYKGDSLDLKTLVDTATDPEEGDLKGQVEILDDGGFDNTVVDTYTITFKVTDSKGASAQTTATVEVKNQEAWTLINQAPSITVHTMTIYKGDSLDLKTLVDTATDPEEGDLKGQVEVLDDGGFDNAVVGIYTITFKVTDSKGASARTTATVEVKNQEAWTPINQAPKVVGHDVIIYQGDNLDIMSLVNYATDSEDGDLTGQVVLVDDGGFDNTMINTYTITLKVTDSQGVTGKTTVRVEVVPKRQEVLPTHPLDPTPPEKPTKPSEPSNPSTPSQPTSPTEPSQPTTSIQANVNKGSVLPDTGETTLSLFGPAALTILSGLSLLMTGKLEIGKENEK